MKVRVCLSHSLHSFMQNKKQGSVAFVFKDSTHFTPTPQTLCSLLSPLSPLCTLKAQVEAGVSQLNIYTFLAFILLHTYLTSMNGALLTPFNSHSKQVLLARLMCNN